jgi:conjugal transfer mating pair stabilization protein TraG
MVEVITHGGGEALWHAFNAIALLFKKSGVMGSLVYLSMNFSIIVATTQMIISQDSIRAFKWAFAVVFIMNALMLPKVNVMIIDRAALYERKVDNVPFILGFSAAFSSGLGDFLAKKFDEVFAPPGLEYSKTGIAMSSKLVTNLSQMTFPHPDSAANLRAFLQQCMVPDIARGKYTLQEIKQTNDLWGFLEKTSSPIRSMPYYAGMLNPGVKKVPTVLTCREVAREEAKNWKTYLDYSGYTYGRLFFPDHKDAPQLLLAHLPVSYEYLTGMSQDASAILRQNIMRNLIRDGMIELNAVNGTTDLIKSYAVARAQEQQKTAYALHGETASLSLSTLKVLFEVLVYSLFPIAATIALFPGGLSVLKEYLMMMFSIQAWAPMYAILNMILNVTAKSKSIAAVTIAGVHSSETVLSFSTIPRLTEANEWISAVAGYGMGLIPFLAYGIFRYGAGALTQISSHFGSIAQSALGHAAEEATTGNLGMGNTNFSNHSQDNVNAFKHDTNVSVAAGKTSVQELDGATTTTMANGQQVINRDGAISKLGATLNVSEGMSSNLSEGAEISHRAGMQYNEQAMESRVAALNQFTEARKNRALDTSSSEGFSTNESVYHDSGLAKNARIAKDIEKRFALNKNVADRIVGGIKTEAGAGVNLGVVSASVRGYAEASLDRTTTDSESINNAIKYAVDQGVSENWKQSEQEVKEHRYAVLDSENKSHGKGITSNLNESVSQQKMAVASFNEEQAYRKSAQIAENKGAQFNQDMSQEFLEGLIKSQGIEGAKSIVSNPELMRRHASGFIHAEAEKLKGSIKSQGFVFNSEGVENVYKQNTQKAHEQPNTELAFNTYQHTVNNNVDSRLNKAISSNVKERVEQKTLEIKDVINEGKTNISAEKELIDKDVKKFKNRNSAKHSSFEEGRGAKLYDKAD